MLSDYLRDSLFTVAWFGLMAFVWFGWAQEDPPRRWRAWLGVGSTLGLLCAIGFGITTVRNWGLGSALEGYYPLFGGLVAFEVLIAGGGCVVVVKRFGAKWIAWWVAMVVALHFLPLAWLLGDPSIAVLGVIQLVAVGALLPLHVWDEHTTSTLVGLVMGLSFLAYAIVTTVVLLPELLPT